MASEVEICNLALEKLGAGAITSLDDDTVEARACNRRYDTARDALLRRYAWNFAIKRTDLAASTTAPSWEFEAAYPIPADCLRVLEVQDDDAWKREAGNILSDVGDPIYIRYIARITDPAQFDALFVEALASKLAYEMAEHLTQSATKKKLAAADLEYALKEAAGTDALESTSDSFPEGGWLEARL